MFSNCNSPGPRHDDSPVVPAVVRHGGSGVFVWKRFSPGFSQRFSLDSLSLSKDVFSLFVTGSSTCSFTSTLEWNRDGHPQYSHLAVFSFYRLTFQGMILYTFPLELLVYLFDNFAVRDSKPSWASTLEWNRDGHPQYSHLAVFSFYRLEQTTNTFQGMILYTFPLELLVYLFDNFAVRDSKPSWVKSEYFYSWMESWWAPTVFTPRCVFILIVSNKQRTLFKAWFFTLFPKNSLYISLITLLFGIASHHE